MMIFYISKEVILNYRFTIS